MIRYAASALGCVASVALVGATTHLLKTKSTARLDQIDQQLRWPTLGQPSRLDLPKEVLTLATLLGAKEGSRRNFVCFDQRGDMWMTPEAQPVPFVARQTVRISQPGFLWCAALGRWGQISVADYLIAGRGGLEVKLLGALPLSRLVGGAAMLRGETLRYLAELPWNPDAILCNRELDWTVLAADRITVGCGAGAERCELLFQLDTKGLITQAIVESRPRSEDGKIVGRPWFGRFGDYRMMGERLLPQWGEAAWAIDGREFVYWRGRLRRWHGPSSQESSVFSTSRPWRQFGSEPETAQPSLPALPEGIK